MGSLRDDIMCVLNRRSRENKSNTPDFILANYLMDCLVAFEEASKHREDWFGEHLAINNNQSQWDKMPRSERFKEETNDVSKKQNMP